MRPTAPIRALVLVAVLAAGAAPARGQTQQEGKPPLDDASWSLFQRVFGMVLRDHVESKPAKDVILGALQGAASSAGPECAYIPPEETAAYKTLAEPGPGLPLYVTKEADFARILAAFPGQDAAIRPGDSLRFIGGRSTYDMTFPQVLEALRGPAGESVRCIFLKEDAWQSYELTLSRQAPAVSRWVGLGNGSGCLVLPCLEAQCSAEVVHALQAAKGPVLVDLRGCASDDAKAALRWGGMLLGNRQGPGRKGNQGTLHDTMTGPGFLAGRTVRVLVDGTTARGGEVLAAALAESGATVVGAPTFGFSPYIEEFPLQNGGLLRLSTAFFLAPDGLPMKDHPIAPAVAFTGQDGQKPEQVYAQALKAQAPAKAPKEAANGK